MKKYPLGLKKDTFLSVIWLTILLVVIGAFLWYYRRSKTIISPVPQSYVPVVIQNVYIEKIVYQEVGDPIINEIVKVFRKEGRKTVGKAIACAYGESKLDPNAYNFNTNKTGDYNIFQVNTVHIKEYGDKFMHDWKENIRVAYDLYKKYGWKIWYSPYCN